MKMIDCMDKIRASMKGESELLKLLVEKVARKFRTSQQNVRVPLEKLQRQEQTY